jgi:excisionase family DNA binding protein
MLDVNVDLSGVPFEERSFGVKQAIAILSISETFFFELIAAGEIDTYKSGRSRKITGKAINAYRAKCKADAA